METEIWKDILGYEGLYQISNLGNIKSLERKVIKGKGGLYTLPEKILKQRDNGNGYLTVLLCKNGKYNHLYIHRLAAQAFIPNPDNLPQVNHINEIKTDNRVDNLEYCDTKYNCNYGTRTERIVEKQMSRPILCVELNKLFSSIKDAARWFNKENGHCNIILCLKGKQNTAYGYHWKYV